MCLVCGVKERVICGCAGSLPVQVWTDLLGTGRAPARQERGGAGHRVASSSKYKVPVARRPARCLGPPLGGGPQPGFASTPARPGRGRAAPDHPSGLTAPGSSWPGDGVTGHEHARAPVSRGRPGASNALLLARGHRSRAPTRRLELRPLCSGHPTPTATLRSCQEQKGNEKRVAHLEAKGPGMNRALLLSGVRQI